MVVHIHIGNGPWLIRKTIHIVVELRNLKCKVSIIARKQVTYTG